MRPARGAKIARVSSSVELERRSFRVHGRVQGVAFRAYTVRAAERIGVTGFVQNCADGTVAGEVQGAPQAVAEFVEWLDEGSPWAAVEAVDAALIQVAEGDGGFRVRRS